MNKYKFYLRWGGLMEDPIFRWEFDGYGEGENVVEACDNKYKNDSTYNEEYKTLWGMVIGYETEDKNIVPIDKERKIL